MCMLFIKPENLTLPDAYFDSLKDHNADGVSIFNFADNQLIKTLDYDEAKQYLDSNHDNKLIVHFRYGTSGKSTLDQLHGWNICNDEYLFFHNGVLTTFKGDKEYSDTQKFVNFVNTVNWNIDQVVDYLEQFELSSRFMILKKSDNSVIIPNCAKWAKPITLNETTLQFSNDYAIDFMLQKNNGHIGYVKSVNRWNSNYKFDASRYGIYSNSDFNDDEFEDDYFEDDTLMDELENIIYFQSDKDLLDFVMVNPDTVVKYLKKGSF